MQHIWQDFRMKKKDLNDPNPPATGKSCWASRDSAAVSTDKNTLIVQHKISSGNNQSLMLMWISIAKTGFPNAYETNDILESTVSRHNQSYLRTNNLIMTYLREKTWTQPMNHSCHTNQPTNQPPFTSGPTAQKMLAPRVISSPVLPWQAGNIHQWRSKWSNQVKSPNIYEAF